jgi:HAD superfamily hydrolase (TIGR01490 family)
VALALFDLDNTLLAGDSDHLWGEYLAHRGIVDGELYRRENDRFLRAYEEGSLDIQAFLRFSLDVLARHDPADLLAWRHDFIDEWIRPRIASGAPDLVARHRDAGDRLVIITATNRFVTEPIAELLAVDTLIATEPEWHGGRYTGNVAGTPCFREGKIRRLDEWLAGEPVSAPEPLLGSTFYSDSHNDVPLLERVANPVAVDPDPRLAATANERGWPVISLRADTDPR